MTKIYENKTYTQIGALPWALYGSVNDSDADVFTDSLMQYSQDNLLQINVYISKPFATQYTTEIVTSHITMLSNMGGLLGLCMGFSVVSLLEIFHLVVSATFLKKK